VGATGHYISDLDIDNWPSGATDLEEQAVIDTAEAILDAALHTHYYPKPFDLRLNGNGQNRIFLPLKANILTVTYVSLWGELVDPSFYAFDNNSIYVNPESGAGDAELSYLLSEFSQYAIFPRGYNNVRVKGTCGPASVPAWVKAVAVMLARDQNDPTLYTHYLESESIGRYSYKIGAELAQAKGLTGLKEADDIIKLFRRGKSILMAP
jgi:hypothetical protein